MNAPPVLLLDACCHARHREIEYLLSQGADVHHVWPGGLRLVHVAASRGDVATLKLVLAAGADCNAIDGKGEAPLHLAVAEGHLGVLQVLKQAGADLDQTSYRGNTPLHVAMDRRQFEAARHLLWFGARTSHRNLHGLTCEDMVPVLDQPNDLVDLFRAARLRNRRRRLEASASHLYDDQES